MSSLFSRQCEYALQAVLYLAGKPDGEMTPIRELTQRLEIPYHFLGKILQDLTRKRLLVSLKGPTGGFALGKPAGEITLFQVVEAVDGTRFFSECVLGFPECGGEKPCPVHDRWGLLRDEIQAMLLGKNIAQLSAEMKRPEYRAMKFTR